MNFNSSNRFRWSVVFCYATGMAWVEAAVVFYLRTMVNRIEPYQPNPLPIMGGLGTAELVREAATLIMLLTVGILAGRSWRSRLGYAAVAFGIWDILYYVFLKVLCGWPHSLLDWDILFLLPLPWWGPVLAPVLISVLMIVWGTLAAWEWPARAGARVEIAAWALNACGIVMALCVFMAETFHVALQSTDAVRNVLPHVFNWRLFNLALTLMSAPTGLAFCRLICGRAAGLNSSSLRSSGRRGAGRSVVATRLSEPGMQS
ncbi:MAG TPA: hypothetical protein VL793_14350 [Patescibacteria group bacterium]|jgi:hypothetical protein|nr:hypothetical protein [Patescibacteria group bacterium]